MERGESINFNILHKETVFKSFLHIVERGFRREAKIWVNNKKALQSEGFLKA